MVAATVVAAIDQDVANTGGAHFTEGDFDGVVGQWNAATVYRRPYGPGRQSQKQGRVPDPALAK